MVKANKDISRYRIDVGIFCGRHNRTAVGSQKSLGEPLRVLNRFGGSSGLKVNAPKKEQSGSGV